MPPTFEDPLPPVDVPFLRRFALSAFLDAFGLPSQSRIRPLLTPLLWLPAQLFARVGERFDGYVAEHGFDAAARWVLPRFSGTIETYGAERVPTRGPLVVACNHPGASDALAIAGSLPRDDLKILAYGIPFVKALTHAAQHFIFSSEDLESNERMLSVRAALRHLRTGGSLLIFPSGHIGPDPGVLPGGRANISTWSRSLMLFLRRVPESRLQLTYLSHTVLPSFFDHSISRRRSGVARQILAQYLQTVAQVLFPRRPLPLPKLSFHRPISLQDLESSADPFEALLDHARALLDEHISHFGGIP